MHVSLKEDTKQILFVSRIWSLFEIEHIDHVQVQIVNIQKGEESLKHVLKKCREIQKQKNRTLLAPIF